MKKFILGIIVGGIIFGTSVFALSNYLYKADEVSYNPKDNTWNVDNVKGAIDELYSINASTLNSLKNTNIAKAVNANGDTFSSVISKLDEIQNHGKMTKTISPGGVSSIDDGYYSGGSVSCSSCSYTNRNILMTKISDRRGTFNVTTNDYDYYLVLLATGEGDASHVRHVTYYNHYIYTKNNFVGKTISVTNNYSFTITSNASSITVSGSYGEREPMILGIKIS